LALQLCPSEGYTSIDTILSVPSYGALALQHNLATSYTIDVNPAFSPLLRGQEEIPNKQAIFLT